MDHALLIVEDDADIRQNLAEILRDEGHEVETACNGAEALEHLQKKLEHGRLPCLILLDLMMPVMNGWDFRAKQLSHPTLAGVPVVLLSGATDVRHHAATLQTAGYLTKPIPLDRLFQLVEQNC